jgi:hypothetical protein
MKAIIRSAFCGFVVTCASFCLLGAEDPKPKSPFIGIWKWTFTMPDGTQVNPRLKVKEADGKLSGVSSFRPGTEASVTNLEATTETLKFQVVRERDGKQIMTQYSGVLSSNELKGKIVSNWNGDDQSYPWVAKRVSGLDGTWKWTIRTSRFAFESRAVLKQDGEKVTGKVLGGGRFPDLEIKEGEIKKNHVAFQTEFERDGEKNIRTYHGKLEGDKITGKTEGSFGAGALRTNDWAATRVD